MEKIAFLSIVSLVQCSMVSLVIASLANSTTDQFALLSFRSHITSNPNNILTQNWSTTTPVCSWIGVTCGIRHHRVTALNLSYLGLTGTIPPQLGNLSFLTVLAIRNNSFYGSLPHELAQLRRLKHIDFTFNNINAEIPSWFGSFHKLQQLLLRGNNFVGAIPLSLSNISSLQELDLGFNQLSGRIPKEFGNLTELKGLSLRHNEIRGGIPEELGKLAKLGILVASENALTGPIPSSIFNLSSLISMHFTTNNLMGSLPDNMCQHLPILQGLHLSLNQLNGSIPYNLWQCRELRIVSLSVNQFRGNIPRDIGNLTFLTDLFLGRNTLIGEIPSEIGNLRNLESLALQMANLTGPIPATIFNMSTLELLTLTENNFSGSTIPWNIGLGLPNLEELYLAGCGFWGTIPASLFTNSTRLFSLELGNNSLTGFIPTTIGDLRSLESLSLFGNQLTTSTPDLSFLSSLTNCKNLRTVHLGGNPLNGILPSSIGNLSISLEQFAAQNCNISGNIPEEIGNLNNLTVLSLENNELTGSIPVSLGQLQKLQDLSLQANNLEGSIPENLCYLERLFDLYLAENKLSGSVPKCLGNLTALRYLSLGSNALTSTIPSTLWSLKDILYVNLSSNNLNGPLSFQVANLKVMFSLDLSWNHLSGDIPSTIGGLKHLQLLNFSHNRLEGPIPESFGELTSLEFLDLSNNRLLGVIPESLEALLYLKYLNLSFNRLEGNIPTRGPFTNFSIESFMGNYALCGSVLLRVPPCKKSTHQKRSASLHLLAFLLPISIGLTLFVLALILVLRRCRKRNKKRTNEADISLQLTWRRISYHELVRATDDFSETNLLGIGSFGSVYKGRLHNGIEIAIKVFHQQYQGEFKSFDVECEVISNIRHRNLTKVLSCCSNEGFKALVLEYMPNGSLEQCLYSNNRFLDILQRLNIMIDIASALDYLHFGCSTPFVHCDVKPSNVLLDENLVAHLSDFGITKIFGEEESMIQTQTLATIGYMAPEYGREGKVSRNSDVYSYGIMLMETFTRKKPTDEIFAGEMSLKHWISDALQSTIMEVVDTYLLRREDEHFVAKEQCIHSVLSVAMECTRESPMMRINIKEAVNMLLKIRVTLLGNIERTGSRRP